MDGNLALYLGRRGLQTALLMAAPVLAVTLVTGFAVAMLQAVTSIRDMTLGLVLKVVSVAVALLVCGGWMMQLATGFAMEVFNCMQAMGQ